MPWGGLEDCFSRCDIYQGYIAGAKIIRVFTAIIVKLKMLCAASLFEVELPSDIDVTKGFSALSGLSASTTD